MTDTATPYKPLPGVTLEYERDSYDVRYYNPGTYTLRIENPFIGYRIDKDGRIIEVMVSRVSDRRIARALAALFECDVVVESE